LPRSITESAAGVAALDLDRLTRLEIVALDEAQERRILIGDAGDAQRRAELARQQVVEVDAS
jgi:hypothetical protein